MKAPLGVEAVGRYKGMSRCATRAVEGSPDREASPGRTVASLRLKNEASLHAYSTPSGHDVFGRFAGGIAPMNTGKWSGDGDVGGSPTPSQPSPQVLVRHRAGGGLAYVEAAGRELPAHE